MCVYFSDVRASVTALSADRGWRVANNCCVTGDIAAVQ